MTDLEPTGGNGEQVPAHEQDQHRPDLGAQGAAGAHDSGNVDAESVTVHQGAIGQARAHDVTVTQGAVGFARADAIDVGQGFVGTALGGQIHARQAFVRFAAARDAIHLEQALAMTAIANHVHISPRSFVLFLVARSADGEVRPVFDWRGALAFGAAFGLVRSLFRVRRR
jgi:hypothetical protein